MSERKPNCEWVLERVDAFVDGELGEGERAAVTAHCASCGECTRELDLAIRVRRELLALPSFKPPTHVIDTAEREADAVATNVIPIATHRRRRVAARMAAALAAAAVVVVGAIVWQHTRQPQYSEADVRRATAEIAMAFGYVDRYSDGVVREDVLEKRVMPRIERALSRDNAKQDDRKSSGM
ncbi:MAG TPA: zf-HC2 domain-containing protein [Candidatus Krumholzibacteria bacterium]|nr:zf-HC2 domain-containing protein [Candidatus Krumholzibacteria bacterium]